MQMEHRLVLSILVFFAAAVSMALEFDPSVEELYYFESNYAFELSAAPVTYTLKLPASSSRPMIGSAAVVCSTVDTVITQELGGTATGGTAMSPKGLNVDVNPATTVLRGASTSGGTQIGVPIAVLANDCSGKIDLSKILFRRGRGADQVYNLKSTSETGTISVSVTFAERR